mgnify:CR=1 FL=1
MPSESIADEKRKNFYKKITEWSWNISFYDEPLYQGRIKELVHSISGSEITINALPESSALFVSYQHSINYQEGHYILIDIGAGTTDINYMIVHNVENENNATEVVRSVKPYGAAMLMKHIQCEFDSHTNWYRWQAFPNIKKLKSQLMESEENIKLVIDQYLQHHYFTQLQQAGTLARQRDTHFDRESLKNGDLPYHYFLTGGGSSIEYYIQETLKFSDINNEYNLSGKEFPLVEYQERKISKKTNNRLLVAYGLSWHELDFLIPIEDSDPDYNNIVNANESGMNPDIIGPEQM